MINDQWLERYGCSVVVCSKRRRPTYSDLIGQVYSVSQKNPPPEIFWHFFPNGWEFFAQILHTCYMFLSTLEYNFLFN